ncbi:flagellar protein FlgN [bacterium]|nr:flagellar protein FlgN [bacterium]
MKTKELQELLEYFGREQACYTSLLDLSRQQRMLIEDGQMDHLLAVLGHKQQILGQVSEIETRLRPFKENWDVVRQSLSRDDRGMVDDALSTVEELLGELIGLEKESEELLVSQMSGVRQEMNEVATAKGVSSAYAQIPTSSPRRVLDFGANP